MFADELVGSSSVHSSNRFWTTLVSFAMQALALASLLAVVRLAPQSLPPLQWMSSVVAPAALPAPETPAAHNSRRQETSNLTTEGHIVAPPSIPNRIASIEESSAPPPVDPDNLRVFGGTGDRFARNPVIGSVGDALRDVSPPPEPPAPKLRVSRMMEGNLIHRVQPDYPSLARQAAIQGSVVLQAVISRDGTIENLRAVSGHPLLIPAAIDAVRQWRYRPYYLNDQAVEVETQITVNFVLSGR